MRAIVVGSGPVGAATARRLVERGCDTTLFEAGAPVAVADSPHTRPGEHLRNARRSQREPEAFIIEAIGHCAFYDATAAPDGLPGACETTAFGGQSILWTNNCPRLQAGLERWDALDDATWERRYAEAEALLHVGTAQFAASERQRRVAARLAAHLAAAGRRIEPLPMAGYPDGHGGIHFVATADILADLAGGGAAERLHVRCGARAEMLAHDGRHVTAVRLATAGGVEEVAADAVVVAGGVFATPRLLYASGIRPPALGRWLHYHPLLLAQVVLDEALAAPAGREDPPPRLWIPPTRSAPWHGMVLRDVGAGAPGEMVEEGRLIELQFFAPVEPRPEHRMRLDTDPPRFEVRLAADDRAMLDAMRTDVEAIGAALGRWRAGCAPDWNPCGFSHPMGSTRMGDDSSTSVVDRSGRVHGFDNLYLAGVGLIPVRVAVNPTLTAIARALETADHIARRTPSPARVAFT
jgi:choline dehydrogenase-like flavoprotein